MAYRYFAQQASLLDGKLDISIVKPASMLSNLIMIRQFRQKTLMNNPESAYTAAETAATEAATSSKGGSTAETAAARRYVGGRVGRGVGDGAGQ